MAILAERAAAYTRTGILRRFLELLGESLPARVDTAFAESRLGLKGGDVRAFLQSARVLGLVDPYGSPTELARRARATTQRSAAMREALALAYPELMERWQRRGGMERGEVEDFFKVDYGLSASSSGPAAKLFLDLMREFAGGTEAPAALPVPFPSPASTDGPERSRSADACLAALETVRSTLRIDIDADWDEPKIRLVFDRLEQLVDRILASR